MNGWIGSKYEAEHDDYNAIMVETLADRLAKLCRIFKKVNRNLGYSNDENLENDRFNFWKYVGICPVPRLSSCPDHLEKTRFGIC